MKQAFFNAAAVLIRCFGVTFLYTGLILLAVRSYLWGVFALVFGIAALGFHEEA